MKEILRKILGLDKPSNIIKIYKGYNILTQNFFTVPVIIAVISSILTTSLVFLMTHDMKKTIAGATFIITSAFAIVILMFYILLKIIKHTGTDQHFIFPGKYLIKRKSSLPWKFNLSEIKLERFVFATSETVNIATEINLEAYEGTIWGTDPEMKYQRNTDHQNRNDQSILLFKSPNLYNYIGFSHSFPVSKMSWDDYIDGQISDSDFDAEHISPRNIEPNNENFYGIIFFSIGLRKIRDGVSTDIPFTKENVGDIFEQAMAVHLSTLAQQFSKGVIPVLIQNMGSDFLNHFKGNSKFKTMSKDGALLIIFNIKNTNV